MQRGAIMSVILISACSVPVAAPVPQGPLRVSPYGFADGLTAKRVAEAICAKQGRRLDPTAFGHFSAGSWEFAGGCRANQ